MLTRTTLRIERDLYTNTKKLAIDLNKNVQEIMNEALIVYLPILKKKLQETNKQTIKFGAYNIGFKGIRRKELYEDR